jgi:hypothetical protein
MILFGSKSELKGGGEEEKGDNLRFLVIHNAEIS